MDDLQFSILGPMRGQLGTTDLRLGSPQQQAMLAALLLRPGHTAAAADLIQSLWGDEPPSTAVTTVRTYAWRLRKVLRGAADGAEVLVSLGGGYRLLLAERSVDALRAEELGARADRARAAEQPAQARELLNQALALWQGEPLAGLPGPFAERQRSRLADLRLALLEERLTLDLALGGNSGCVSELTALTAEYPLRERPYALLMRALCQAGRMADALGVFRSARRLLVEDLGVEPGPELTAVHRRVLDGDPALAAPELGAVADRTPSTVVGPPAVPTELPGAAEEQPALGDPPAGTPRPAQLPPDAADFTGRTELIGPLLAALTDAGQPALRVVALTGMGGVGKTTLALHLAHRAREFYPDGQLYANLRGSDRTPADPEAVLAGFLAALNVPPPAIPEGVEAKAALFRSLVDGRRLLIVLDNARDPAGLQALLPGSAGCAVLVTSRVRLAGLPCTLQYDLPVFRPAEAVELLSRAIGPERLAAEPEAGLELVSACGFLPLAVRIVAARLAARPTWTVQTLCSRLANERRRIDELRIGALAVEAAFELGYHQLTVLQARAFRLVALVDGPDVALASAAALLGEDEHEAEDLLESLVDVAMLESPAPRRYRFHDLLRAFARRTSESEHPHEAGRPRARLLAFLLATACEAFRHAVPGDPLGGALGGPADPDGRGGPAGLAFGDLAAARSWASAEAESALALVAQIARDPGPAEVPAAINLLIALSPFGPDPRHHQLAATAAALVDAAVAAGDRRAEGRARFLYGNIAMTTTRFVESEPQTRLAVQCCREVGDQVILRQALNDLGLLSQYLCRYDEAVGHFDEAIAIARRLGHRSGLVVSTVNAALARVRSGRATEALTTCQELLPDLRARRDEPGTAYTLYVLGLAAHTLDRFGEAVGWFTECLAVCARAGLPGRAAHARYRLADALRALGEPEQAVAHAEQALALCEELGADRDRAHALVTLGRALGDLGRTGQAREQFRTAHAIFTALGLPEAESTAALLAERQDLAEAATG